jgi:hypothetical protein
MLIIPVTGISLSFSIPIGRVQDDDYRKDIVGRHENPRYEKEGKQGDQMVSCAIMLGKGVH